MSDRGYCITTPIYYVNDKPHIGHCYTTAVADVAARMARLIRGDEEVFFLTGTDEHAEKVVSAARERGLSPQAWADQNAAAFERAFAFMGCTNTDFIRTSQARHTERVDGYIRELVERGAVYLGDYEGWYDPSQEEYVTESVAKEYDFLSPVTKKPLVKRTEQNYFFKLTDFEDRLLAHIEAHPGFIRPEARRNEVLGRIRQGLRDVPISRAVGEDDWDGWGCLMPDDPEHRVYVWIDALFNYLSAVDTDERRDFWPADVHVIAKDILWFHCVIWPCLLMALDRPLPGSVYVHSYWVAEGTKMSKSLGNFVDLPLLRGYADRYSLDAVRWFLLTQGPLGATDADFSHRQFVEVYNADLANTVGNSVSRVGNMIHKYFDGVVPEPGGVEWSEPWDWPALAGERVRMPVECFERFDLESALHAGRSLVEKVDLFINETAPFKLAKKLDEDPGNRERLGSILYHCAEALRIASLLLSPAMPGKMEEVWSNWGCAPAAGVPLRELAAFGGAHALKPGSRIEKGAALFMRADADESRPEPIEE